MSKCWYCNEELTSATYRNEHIGICTKCYDSMFKVSNGFIKELTDKISDLEAKLAEYEKFMKDNEWNSIEEMQETLNKCEKKYANMQQQLAESESRFLAHKQYDAETIQNQSDLIEKLKSEKHSLMSDNAYQEADIFELKQKLAIQNQDKISFCIEKLKKVKEFSEDMCGIYKAEADIIEYIDNQIKQLKETIK